MTMAAKARELWCAVLSLFCAALWAYNLWNAASFPEFVLSFFQVLMSLLSAWLMFNWALKVEP